MLVFVKPLRFNRMSCILIFDITIYPFYNINILSVLLTLLRWPNVQERGVDQMQLRQLCLRRTPYYSVQGFLLTPTNSIVKRLKKLNISKLPNRMQVRCKNQSLDGDKETLPSIRFNARLCLSVAFTQETMSTSFQPLRLHYVVCLHF